MNAASAQLLAHFLHPQLPLHLYTIAAVLYTVATDLAEDLDSPNPAADAEVTAGLRKLREAKDCFVLAKVILESPA